MKKGSAHGVTGVHLFLAAACLLGGASVYHRYAVSRIPMPTVSVRFRDYLLAPDARMVAYAPDFDAADVRNQKRLNQQLTALHDKFNGLVLYGCTPQTQEVVSHATTLGYRAVLLTVWDPRSRKELQTANDFVDRFHGHTIFAVSIGSEGLLQGRYTMDDLIRAKRILTQQPQRRETVEITTTEPWWMYLRRNGESEQLVALGDFVTANVHVIWDTKIREPAAAADWTMSRARELQQAFHQVVLVREAGFPGNGYSPRVDVQLAFTRDLQADFWSAIQKRGAAIGGTRIPVVAFEAFDNSTKQWDSFESFWGLMNAELRPYPAWNAFPNLAEQHAFNADAAE